MNELMVVFPTQLSPAQILLEVRPDGNDFEDAWCDTTGRDASVLTRFDPADAAHLRFSACQWKFRATEPVIPDWDDGSCDIRNDYDTYFHC